MVCAHQAQHSDCQSRQTYMANLCILLLSSLKGDLEWFNVVLRKSQKAMLGWGIFTYSGKLVMKCKRLILIGCLCCTQKIVTSLAQEYRQADFIQAKAHAQIQLYMFEPESEEDTEEQPAQKG